MEEQGAGANVQRAMRETSSEAVDLVAPWKEGTASWVVLDVEKSIPEAAVEQETGGKTVRMKVERVGLPSVPKGIICGRNPGCNEERLVEGSSGRWWVVVWGSPGRTSTSLAVAAAWSSEPQEAGEIESCARANSN